MGLLQMVWNEIAYRKMNFALGVLAVAIACGTLLSVVAGLRAYDMRSRQTLARKEQQLKDDLEQLRDEIRKATLKLSFNLVVLPKDQDMREWHERGYGTTYMPEDYVHRLANSKLIIVRHFLPILQQKVAWPEMHRTVILIGCRGEVPNLHKGARSPLVQIIPDGKMTVGHEVHTSLGIKPGQDVRFMGKSFVVHKCHEERGSRDDITVWIPLADAQEILGKEKMINAILCLQCLCMGNLPIERIRAEVAERLPDTHVIEFGTKILARAEARFRVKHEAMAALDLEKQHQRRLAREREKLVSVLVPGVIVVCVACVGLLSFLNTRNRRSEVGILRAMGYSERRVTGLLLSRSLVTGLIGGILGCVGAVAVGLLTTGESAPGALTDHAGLPPWPWLLGALVFAPVMAALAGWPPVVAAAKQDPAALLRKG